MVALALAVVAVVVFACTKEEETKVLPVTPDKSSYANTLLREISKASGNVDFRNYLYRMV